MSSNNNEDLFVRTPLIESTQLKEFSPRKVFLKLECCQPSASFKMRGISRLCQSAALKGSTQVVCASGGNAGLAAAVSARLLGMTCRIIVPSTTSQLMKDMIAKEGADIEVYGNVWDEANERALQIVKGSDGVYVHPFDDPIVWSGHSTIIDEIAEQLRETPSMIIASCGGGGLLSGIVQGMRRHNWTSVPILAVETIGADSFNAAIRAGIPVKPFTISAITSVAKCLGALTICQQLANDYNIGSPPITSKLFDDRVTVDACIKFADQHRILVEPACGVSLAALYTGYVRHLFEENSGKYSDGPIVVIVCGGASVSLDLLNQYKKDFNL